MKSNEFCGMRSPIIVTIVDGRPYGYITIEELAKKFNVTPGYIRINIRRGNIDSLVIGYGKWKTHWFKEDYILEKRSMGRPKKKVGN